MHSRVLHISSSGDVSARPEVSESVVLFSRGWAIATTPGRVLRRDSGTNRWSHGGGLFTDTLTGEKFVLQSIWPIVDEPDLWVVDALPDVEEACIVSAPRVTTDQEARRRIEGLLRAETHRRARDRVRPRRPGEERSTIRLMVEYGLEWPLWTEGVPLEPWELGLSAGLTERLRGWNDLWATRYDFEKGWATERDRETFARDAVTLATVLADEVRHFADVEVVGV
jgi:hypothetical protein